MEVRDRSNQTFKYPQRQLRTLKVLLSVTWAPQMYEGLGTSLAVD